MRITVLAVGRMKPGAEADLVSDYLDRFTRTGRALGLGPGDVREVEDRKGGGQAGEAALLAAAIPDDARLIALDERGKLLTSPQFSQTLCDWRDDGTRHAVLMIGGADGLTPELRARADLTLSFGKMVWPHMLVRAMLAEQIYRAATIAAGSPYHRV